MIKFLLRNYFASKANFSQEAKGNAFNSFWMLHTKTDNGAGSSVLIRPNVALTLAHNFWNCKPNNSQLISPRTGEILEIKSAIIDEKNDIAILQLKKYRKKGLQRLAQIQKLKQECLF